uniref:Uncharacterized protein n=1 Tax=Candidatus Methanophaga sp. ANME-1 ERB7 TaxID=2759913 RepID=A0A7G9Z6W1_9EURY|nr:hypothetical protein DPHACCJJ_00010 [Methanosarcinales archaeon ANME-1 ERB7]
MIAHSKAEMRYPNIKETRRVHYSLYSEYEEDMRALMTNPNSWMTAY